MGDYLIIIKRKYIIEMGNLIETSQLRKSFTMRAGELQVLKGIDLSINEGEMVGIVGASGVGKSTLLHILGTLDKPTIGKVFLNGIAIFSLDEDSLATFRNETIGFVFQFHHLLPEFTALENVMMPGLINKGSRGQGSKGPSYKEIIKKAEVLLNEMGLS